MHAYGLFDKMGSPNKKSIESGFAAIVAEIGEEKFKEIIDGMDDDEK